MTCFKSDLLIRALPESLIGMITSLLSAAKAEVGKQIKSVRTIAMKDFRSRITTSLRVPDTTEVVHYTGHLGPGQIWFTSVPWTWEVRSRTL